MSELRYDFFGGILSPLEAAFQSQSGQMRRRSLRGGIKWDGAEQRQKKEEARGSFVLTQTHAHTDTHTDLPSKGTLFFKLTTKKILF